MSYVSYQFYTQTYGGTLPEADFTKAEARAEAAISYLTYVNGDIFAAESDSVKLAVCAAAETIHNQTKATGGAAAIGKKSESNDGYAVTYVAEGQDGQTAEELLRKKVYEAIRLYLLPTGWLCRKVRTGGCRDVCADSDHAL